MSGRTNDVVKQPHFRSNRMNAKHTIKSFPPFKLVLIKVYSAYPSSRPNMFYNKLWDGNGGVWDAISSNHGIAW